MKNLLLVVFALISTTLFAQEAKDVAKFDKMVFDFGKVQQGTASTATFVVTNIGKTPLIIDQAAPSCGCTVSDYTKTPIQPGATGYIKATYDGAAVGRIDKNVTVVFAGIQDPVFLKLAGEVITKK